MIPSPSSGEIVFARFVRLLKRLWWCPLLVAIALSVLSASLSSARYQTSGAAIRIPANAQLESAGLDTESLAVSIPFSVDGQAVSGDAFRDNVLNELGLDDTADVVVAASADSVSVTVTADTDSTARAVLVRYLTTVQESRASRLDALVESMLSQQAAWEAELEGRAEVLDDQLAGLSDPGSSLANALLGARAEVEATLVEAKRLTGALSAVVAGPASVVQIVNTGDVSVVSGRTLRAIAGASFGLLLGLAFIYGAAYFARTVRSRDDINQTGMPVLAALSHQAPRADLMRLASVLAGVARSQGAANVRLLPVDEASAKATSMSGIVEAISEADSSLRAEALPTTWAGPGVDSDGGQVVMVVVGHYGESSMQAFGQLGNDLDLVGTPAAGAVILGVPRRALGAVHATRREHHESS